MYRVNRNQATAVYSSLYFFHFSFSPMFKHWHFSSHFSKELWGVEGWDLVHTWEVGRCVVYSGIWLLLLIRPFIIAPLWKSGALLDLLCHSVKFFVTLFSGIVRPRRLKLSSNVDSGQRFRVYRNQAADAYSSLYFFTFLSLQSFEHWNFLSHFSGTVRPRRLKLGTHVDSGQLYRVYWNQSAAAYSSLYFFIFLSLQFSNIEIFCHISQELWELEDWNLVHTWTVGSCIVYTGISLLLLIHPFISSFFFLSNFQTL